MVEGSGINSKSKGPDTRLEGPPIKIKVRYLDEIEYCPTVEKGSSTHSPSVPHRSHVIGHRVSIYSPGFNDIISGRPGGIGGNGGPKYVANSVSPSGLVNSKLIE